MKKLNILLVLGLFVLLVGVAQPVAAAPSDSWEGSRFDERPEILVSFATRSKPIVPMRNISQLNAASLKFEGLLNAYTSNYTVWNKPVRIYTISDLSSSLEEFNTALIEVYPTLPEEEQLAVGEAYSSLGFYLEDLAVRTNSVFGKEVLTIEHQESDGGTLELWTVNVWTLPD